MVLLTAHNIHFRYENQIEPLLEDLSFTIDRSSRIGLVGNNGSGKTTLFKILTGVLKPEEGELNFHDTSNIGYLPQEVRFDERVTVKEYLWRAHPELNRLRRAIDDTVDYTDPAYSNLLDDFHAMGGFLFESRFDRVLSDFELKENKLGMPIRDLSGGEKTKIALCRIILEEPAFLLLDEPTNHLEMEVLVWLENYLKRSSVPFVVISHDRRFLDACAETIWELHDRVLTVYSGNWSFYREEKRKYTALQKHLYEVQQKKIARLEHTARKRKQWAFTHQPQTGDEGYAPVYESVANEAKHAMKQARNVERRIQKMIQKEEAKKPFIEKERKLNLRNSELKNKTVLEVKELSKVFGETVIFRNVSFVLEKGARLGIIGRNGSGKSTLLNIITGKDDTYGGSFHWTPSAKPSYYAQEHENLDPSHTILKEVIQGRNSEQTYARTILGCLNIRGDMVYRQIGSLSLGERSKTALAKIIFADSNILILDEPTNHFELSAREAFEEALKKYAGTILLVTHDRFLLDEIATEMYDMDRCRWYRGTFADYCRKKNEDTS
jgi:ATP-binding cassette subfamily F protein 3